MYDAFTSVESVFVAMKLGYILGVYLLPSCLILMIILMGKRVVKRVKLYKKSKDTDENKENSEGSEIKEIDENGLDDIEDEPIDKDKFLSLELNFDEQGRVIDYEETIEI